MKVVPFWLAVTALLGPLSRVPGDAAPRGALVVVVAAAGLGASAIRGE